MDLCVKGELDWINALIKVDAPVKSLQARESGSPQVVEFPGFPLSRE